MLIIFIFFYDICKRFLNNKLMKFFFEVIDTFIPYLLFYKRFYFDNRLKYIKYFI